LITGFLVPLILRRFGGEGWRYSWYFLGSAAAFISLLCLLFLRDPPRGNGTHDSGGSGSSEKRRRTGTIVKKVLTKKYLWILAGIYTAFGFSYVIYATFFTRVLLNSGEYTENQAGFLWSTVGAVSAAAAFFWGWVSDRLGRKYALAMVYGLQGLSFGLFVLWPQPSGFLLSALLFGITGWSIPAIMAASSGDLLGARYAGTAFGIVTLFFGIGQIAGPFTAGRIALASGSYAGAYGIASAVAVAGAVLSLLFLPRRMESSR
jgi:sugar phosphate permease